MIRLALIGCGDGGGCAYVPFLARLVDLSAAGGAQFVAVVDSDLDQATVTGRALDAAITASSLDELLRRNEEFDAVILHSDNRQHAADVESAARAGKHVLVRAPLALTSVAADAAIAACESAGVRLMVGQARRFLPSHQLIKSRIDSGQLGAVGLVRIHRWESLVSTVGNGGSTLFDEVVREIDLANWLFDALPTEVYAVARRPAPAGAGIDEPDYVQVHLGFPGGGMALIGDAQTLPVGGDYYSLSVIGSTGAAYADDHHNMNLLYRGGDPTAIRTGPDGEHILAQLQEFVASIVEERQPSSSGADGRAAVQVAEAVAQSLGSGQAAHLVGGRYELR